MDIHRAHQRPRFDRLVERLTAWLPQPPGQDPTELAYAEASAHRLAARRVIEELELFERLSNISASSVEGARETFARWERESIASVDELDREVDHDGHELRQRQAEALSRVAATDALRELAQVGLLPEAIVDRASRGVANDADEEPDG